MGIHSQRLVEWLTLSNDVSSFSQLEVYSSARSEEHLLIDKFAQCQEASTGTSAVLKSVENLVLLASSPEKNDIVHAISFSLRQQMDERMYISHQRIMINKM